MYSLLRAMLFQFEPEKAHKLALSALNYFPNFGFKTPSSAKPIKAMGLNFPHPIGLAAGLDKNGAYVDALAKIGFSSIEIGTVTPKAQKGNPKPRLFRLPKAQAIINRMGFNNHGVDVLVHNVQKAQYKGILGINIGKNKNTSLNNAADDYLYCLQKVYEHASYVTINISSPNTPDLRQLQQGDFFSHLLTQIKNEQIILADKYKRQVPLVVKVSPDETPETLKKMAEVILHYGIEGIIATNTTCSRVDVAHLPYGTEQGGLSGRPLKNAATQCLELLKKYTGDELVLIGAGGVDDGKSAQEKLDAGASLVQIYTGFIYQGPWLVQRIVDELNVG